MVSEAGGLEFKPQSCILPPVIIPSYRSSYGGTCVAQTSGLSSETLAGTQ
jgi:hypothetical protein